MRTRRFPSRHRPPTNDEHRARTRIHTHTHSHVHSAHRNKREARTLSPPRVFGGCGSDACLCACAHYTHTHNCYSTTRYTYVVLRRFGLLYYDRTFIVRYDTHVYNITRARTVVVVVFRCIALSVVQISKTPTMRAQPVVATVSRAPLLFSFTWAAAHAHRNGRGRDARYAVDAIALIHMCEFKRPIPASDRIQTPQSMTLQCYQ